jgi:hypothetical protein
LESQLHCDFQVTRPLFYGLWIDTPLLPEQASLLLAVFEDAVQHVPRLHPYFDEFIQALRQSLDCGQALHVALDPPGHVDLGWITTFVHCPRCKAEGPFARWQKSYPAEPIACPVCGRSYSPAATYHSEEELFAETVQCRGCKQTFRVRDFTSEEIRTLERWRRYRELCKELSWLDRVERFYRKHPKLEGKINPDYSSLSEITDPNVLNQIFADVPFNELPAPPPPPGLKEAMASMSADELEVVDYLRHHGFSLPHRKLFVERQVSDMIPGLETAEVRCSLCGGEIQ